MSKTAIPYLEEVLNVTSGCTKISEGCANCYAERINLRFGHTPAYDVNCPIKTHPKRLKEALRWRTPRRVGVCFTSDLFHEQVPDEFIDQVFAVMALTPQHTYLLLTKRPERMRAYMKTLGGRIFHAIEALYESTSGRRRCTLAEVAWQGSFHRTTLPLPNVWLGVSVENQARADERIPLLLETPAAHRWVSLEPLLGPIGLSPFLQGGIWFGKDGHGPTVTLPGLDWLVVGGESGPKARPCDLDWIRDIRDQCTAAGVPCYVKQWGAKPMLPNTMAGNKEWIEGMQEGLWRYIEGESWRRGPNGERLGYAVRLRDRKGENPNEWPADLRVRETPEAFRGPNE